MGHENSMDFVNLPIYHRNCQPTKKFHPYCLLGLNWIIAVSTIKFLYDLNALIRGWVDFFSQAFFILYAAYAAFLPIVLIIPYPRREE